MLMDFLRAPVNVLNRALGQAIEKILARRRTILPARDFLAETKRLQAGKLIDYYIKPELFKQGQKLSSNLHNKNMEGAYVRLNSLYAQAYTLGQESTSQFSIITSEFNKAQGGLKQLINKARSHALRKINPEFDQVAVIGFEANYSKEIPAAVTDAESNTLTSAVSNKVRAHLLETVPDGLSIKATLFADGELGNLSRLMPVANMLDQHAGTAWAEAIMTQSPISQLYEGVSYQGAVAELIISLVNSQPINQLRLLPFTEFPLTVAKIQYQEAAAAERWLDLPDFTSESSLMAMTWDFEKIYVSKLKIILVQENPKQLVYKLPARAARTTDLLTLIFSEHLQSIYANASSYQEPIYGKLLEQANSELQQQLNGAWFNKQPGLEVTAATKFSQNVEALLAKYTQTDELNEIIRWEYLLGVRELELNLVSYEPFSYYESETLLPNATLSEVQLNTTEVHSAFTSTEWELDLGRNRLLPILPINCTGINGYFVSGERLDVDPVTRNAYTRFPWTGSLEVWRDGTRLTGGYSWELTTDGHMKFHFPEEILGRYQANYYTDSTSAEIDVLDRLDSVTLEAPEVFIQAGAFNDVTLSYFPYVEYGIINDTGNFSQPDVSQAKWRYQAPIANYRTGHLELSPKITDAFGGVLVNGSTTGISIAATYGSQSGQAAVDWDSVFGSALPTGYFGSPYGYYVAIDGIKKAFQISSYSTSGIFFAEVPELTWEELSKLPDLAFTGHVESGSCTLMVAYSLGVGINYDGQIYGFEQAYYEPLEVTVGNQPAKNLTNYSTLEHPAFTIPTATNPEFQYIHAGNKLYLNQPLNGQTLTANYRWLTQYIKLKGTLISDDVYNADKAPKVLDAYLLINTTAL